MLQLKEVEEEYEKVLEKLADPEVVSDQENFEALLEKKEWLEKIIAKEKELKEVKDKIEENRFIAKAGEDHEFVSLAETETIQLIEKQKELERELEGLLKTEAKPISQEAKAVIVEIRAGAGGEEAALFAMDLFRMYSKYAKFQAWKQKILDSRPTEIGGLKEIVFELKDGDVFSKIKYEAGVHRIQRIPTTEKSGRIHTSTATVAVLPKPKKSEIKINPSDLKIDFYRASGPGGQYVNKRQTAVRITHLPTGFIVSCQTERSLQQNKENAMAILEAKILERKELEQMEKLSEERKTQIGWAKRAEKIRTYNFPQDRITDHRIKKSWYGIQKITDGRLDPIIEALEKEFSNSPSQSL